MYNSRRRRPATAISPPAATETQAMILPGFLALSHHHSLSLSLRDSQECMSMYAIVQKISTKFNLFPLETLQYYSLKKLRFKRRNQELRL